MHSMHSGVLPNQQQPVTRHSTDTAAQHSSTALGVEGRLVGGNGGWAGGSDTPRVAPAPRNPKSLEAALLSNASAALAHNVEVATRLSRLSHR